MSRFPKSNNKKSPVPWWDEECTAAMNKRKNSIVNFKNSGSMDNFLKLKQDIASSQKLFKRKKKRKIQGILCRVKQRNSAAEGVEVFQWHVQGN